MPDLEQIRQLIEQPRESLAVEIKSWLNLDNPRHLAKLIKAALALRNVNGGHIVIGFDNSLRPSADPPSDIVRAYHPDRIQAAVARYASEPFEISVDYPEREGVKYPVISVPAGVRSVVAAKSELRDEDGRVLIAPHDVYVRSLRDNNTPSSARALWRDWEALGQIHFDNREADIGSFVRRHLSLASLQTLREILLQPATIKPSDRARAFLNESRSRFQALILERESQFPDHGAWDVSVVIDGEVPPRKTNREFLRLIDVSNPGYTG